MDATIKEFLQAKRLAVVGVSRSPQKFGTAVYTELKTRGFEVYGVNPHMETILGDKCYPSLGDLAGKIDGVHVNSSRMDVAVQRVGGDAVFQNGDFPFHRKNGETDISRHI